MHWLEQQLDHVTALADGARRGHAREPFLLAIRALVDGIAKHPGVTAAFASHDGLPLEIGGRTPDFEALSAMAQWSLATAKETALTLSLGRMQQMVIVGAEHKLALFHVGQLALGILSPVDTNLGHALEQGPPQDEEATHMRSCPSLLAQLGGRPAVELVVADFYGRVLADADLAHFFRGVSMGRLHQLQVDFFCSVLGGGEPWRGRDMKSAHAGMGITNQQFDRAAHHLRTALAAVGAPDDKSDEVLAIVETVREHVVAPRAQSRAGERK